MATPLHDQINQLQQALAVQESLRGALGDAVVDATVGVLREKLAGLEARAQQIAQLEQAIAVQESLRATLGDAVVEATVGALREKLASLGAGAAAPAPALPAPPPRPEASRPPPTGDQRKQVTILFADVSGFTAMSETMDAEEVLETMNALWARLDAAILEQGGAIDKHIGDAVMALFGAPTAREDDPERAICAALRMQAELGQFRPPGALAARPVNLRMRIGINTGPVLLGAVGTTTEYTAMGDAVNLASRLEHAAPVGGILISHDTYRHVVGVFDVETPAPITVKGKVEPIQVYLVQGARRRTFRVTTRGMEGLTTPMVGREAELRHLQDALRRVEDGRVPHLVTVVGEAGVGKSRLLAEYTQWLQDQHTPGQLFQGRTDPHTSNLPYALIRTLLADRFDIRNSDRAAVARQKLERGLNGLVGPEGLEIAHFLGHLIGFDFSDSPHLRGLLADAQQIRDQAFHYATHLFATVAADRPVVIFLDDIHWADPDSLDLAEYLLHETRNAALLLVCLTRGTLFETRPTWGAGGRCSRLDLQPLSDDDSRRLVTEILRKIPTIPPALLDLIVRGADGNPFYVEELIKKLIEERTIVKGDDQWQVAAERLAEVRVPPTLTGLLQARLDSLPVEERDTLQRAAVVGRIFWESAVARLGEVLRDAVPPAEDALHHLQTKELVYNRDPSTFSDEQEFMFKHALLRDVSYESVLLRLRRVYHAQVAEWLIEHGGERVAEYAGLIGRHYELADKTLAAAEWYVRAGRQAQDTYAPATAVDYYQKALAFLPDTPEYQPQRVPLYDGLGEMQREQARFAEADEAYRAMYAAAQAVGEPAAQARAWLGLMRSQDSQGDHRAALDSAVRAEELARAANAQVELADALSAQGLEHIRLGSPEAALTLAEQALDLSTRLGARVEMSMSLSLLGGVHNMLGHTEQAIRYMEQALAVDRESGALRDMATTLNNLGRLARARGDYEAACALYEEALAIARKIGSRWGETTYRSGLGGALVGLGDYAAAEATLRQVIDTPAASRWAGPPAYRFLAEAYLGQGQVAAALTAAQRAVDLAGATAQQEHLAAAWRVLGLVAAQVAGPVAVGGRDYSAAACFAASLHLFGEMGAEGERARTLRAWAWYERAQGDPHGALIWEEARSIFARLGLTLEVARMAGDNFATVLAG